MNPIDDLNQLGYASSQPDFDLAPVAATKPQDEADLTTMEQTMKVLAARKAYYNSNESLVVDEDEFTIKQQLAISKKMLFHIQELELLIGSTIAKVKEKMNNERR